MFDYEKSLNGEWRLYIEENRFCRSYADSVVNESGLKERGLTAIVGTVPGNFELDMQAAGLITDVFFGTEVFKLQQLENRHLWYCREFEYDCDDTDNVILNFEGIDTFADIYLNGEKIGSSDNMLIACSFPAEGIKNGTNELMVHIKPTCIEARKYNFDFDVNTCLKYNYPSLMTRKAAHSFGWDIFPRAVSGGIWRGVSVLRKKSDYICDVFMDTVAVEDGKAYLTAFYDLVLDGDFAADYSLEIIGVCKESKFAVFEKRLWHNKGLVEISVDEPKLWWPRFMGEQSLYDVKTVLYRNGQKVDEKTLSLGIRKIKLNRTDCIDENGNGEFRFEVNGKPMYVMGTNWVPLDAFHSRDSKRLERALAMLIDINCNAVRCWGGNVYEDHTFFDFCDRNGIIVWQDFAMGCASYPQNDDLCARFKTEVESVVRKLRQHPSLALWAGDNECDEATANWKKDSRDPSKNRLTRQVIPEVLRRLDPFREYLPSSPYISPAAYKKHDLPEMHLWGPRDYFKGDFYVKTTARFASEMGYHGAPDTESVRKFIPQDCLWPMDNDAWLAHASCMETGEGALYTFRNGLMTNQIKVLFGTEPDNLEDFVFESQISQAEAMKFFVEYFRSAKWQRTGLIWWNLIDGWPQFSDSVVDYYYNKKLAYYFIKRSQEPVALMFREPADGKLELAAVNEYPQAAQVCYAVTDMRTGDVVLRGNKTADGCSAVTFDTLDCDITQTKYYYIEWHTDDKRGVNHYVCGKAPYNFEEYSELMSKYGLLDKK